MESRCLRIVPVPVADGMRETGLSAEPQLHHTPTTRRSRSWHSVIDHKTQLYTSLHYLERTAPALTAPWSLAWAILAIAAHRRPITLLRTALLALPDLFYIEDTSTLALVCLALDHEHALANLGVSM